MHQHIKTLLLVAALSVSTFASSQTAPANVPAAPCEMPTQELTGTALMARAATCLDAKKMPLAVTLYQAGLLRLGALAAIDKNQADTPALLGSFRIVLDAPVISWAAADIPTWTTLIGDALAWDDKTPFTEGAEKAKEQGLKSDAWDEVRYQRRFEVMTLINDLRLKRDQIYLARTNARQPVRDPSWTPRRALETALATPHEGHEEGDDHHGHKH